MSHLKSRTIALAAAAVVAAAGFGRVPVASAQQKTIEITPFAGYYIAADIYNSYAGGSYGHVGLANSFMWGGRLTANNPRGGVEFAYTRTGSDVSLSQALGGQPRSNIGRLDIDNYDINFLAYQPSGNPRVTPFGEIGLGWAVTHPQIDSDFISGKGPSGNTLFNFNFGFGAKVAMNPKLSMRLEGRWRVMDTNYQTNGGYWCDPWGYCYSYASTWYNSGELIGGLSYTLR
jgi:hypothetical protein